MRTRHRVPTVFTLYMVDVFCCALGCVILLWLASAREVRRRANVSTDTTAQLTAARQRLASAEGELTSLRAAVVRGEQERDRLSGKLAQLRKERDAARLQAARLHGDLTQLRGFEIAVSASLEKKTREYHALAARMAVSERDLLALRKELEARAEQAKNIAAENKHVTGRLQDAEARAKNLAQRLGQQGKELVEARQTVIGLQAQTMNLTLQAKSARAEAEQRFAGISLTGERVLFLVDMSGSMKMRDVSTEDPGKWPIVCETVAKIQRSLPALKQYQVILFSDRVRYPLGGEGRWLDFDAQSVKATLDALKRVTPKGETNMYAAFAEAFRFRPQGLDTIYLLSDGLPNAGEGLPAGAAGLKETEKATYLGRHVRQTLQTVWNRELRGERRVRINTIGFFFDSPDLGAFLWALAREHDGSFVGMSRP